MDAQKADFLRNDFITLLKKAKADTPANWGKMSFQHMVEHMVLTFKSANGKIKTTQVFTPEEKIAAIKTFLMSDTPFKENTKSPAFPAEPLPLHFANIEQGIDKLQQEVKDFFDVYEKTPGLIIDNPVFGGLNFTEAVQLLHKHAVHHLKQFGLV